jgi:hypothetical protein
MLIRRVAIKGVFAVNSLWRRLSQRRRSSGEQSKQQWQSRMCFHKNIEYLTGTIGTVIEKVALFCIRTIRWSREKISPKNRQNWPVGGKAWPWTPQEEALLGTGQRHRNCRTAGPQNCNRLQATPETRHPQLIHWNVPNTFWTFASLPVLWVTEDMSSCVNLHQKRCGGWSASGSGQAWICSELGLSEAFDLEQGLGNRLDSLIRHIRRKYLREAAFLLFRIEWPA